MRFARPTPLQISIHEAGHTYAFSILAQGQWPVLMILEVNGRTAAGRSKRLKLTETDFSDGVETEFGEDAMLRWCATGEIIVALSGPWRRHAKGRGARPAA